MSGQNSPIGQVIRAARQSRGLDLEEMAAAVDLPANVLALIEEGSLRPPLEVLLRVAVALDVPPKQLYGGLRACDKQVARLAQHSDTLFGLLKAAKKSRGGS